jgi:membrane protein DedA with SNARE-associated domain
MKFAGFVAWAMLGTAVWFLAVVIVWMSLVGDWDDPHPPNPIAAWSVALTSIAAIVVIGWSLRVRAVRYAALGSLPLQFAWWLFMIPKAGIPN